MEDMNNLSSPKKTFSKKKILFWAGSLVFLTAVVILTLYFIHRFQLMQQVQNALKNAATVMEKANGDNGYPEALPAEATKDKNIKLEGGGTFDGTIYCITGTSTSDGSVVSHIGSGDKEPQNGACQHTTVTTKPGIVQGIVTTIVSADQLGFVWQSAKGGVSYTLECASDKNFNKVISRNMKATQTRTCNKLEDGTEYFVRIRANNAAGAGPWSTVLSATTTALSKSPTKLTVTATSANSISYSWNVVSDAESYVVEWATDINFTKGLKSVTTTGTSGTASGLTVDTRYFFHVKAVTANFDAAHAAFSPVVYTSTSAK